MNNNPIDFYNSRLIDLKGQLSEFQKLFRQYVSYRVLALVLIGVSGYFLFTSNKELIFGPIVIIFMGIFIYLVQKHLNIKKGIRRTEKLIEINNQEIGALSGEFSVFDAGAGFQDFAHNNAYDLDLFGARSLYNRINRCTTLEGSERLALLIKQQNSSNLAEKQNRFKELANKAEWRQEFRAKGLLESKNEGFKDLENWFLQRAEFNKNTILTFIAKFSPYIMVLLFILFIAGLISSNYAIAYFFLHLSITGGRIKRINKIHMQLSKKQEALDAYSGLLQVVDMECFDNEFLQKLQIKALGGFVEINRFKKLINLLDSRLNMLMGVLLNGVFLWDINLIIKIENWKDQNADNLKVWIDVIAQMEAENSLANYVFNNPDFNWPNIVSDKVIDAKNISHPFLKNDIRISNDFSLETKGQLVLLSGANMSGKSTFLRTVGLNLVMANMGLPVCAQSFFFKPISIYTSMRINDSLLESESYFYAELKRLKFIVDTITSGKEIFVLLDEILRGTNSNDKHKGSAGLIEQLLGLQTSGIVASHDISLSVLENKFPGKLLNKSFEVENAHGELVFDYKLREGVCHNLNATYLMEKMGVIGKNYQL